MLRSKIFWYILIGAYLALHIGVTTQYFAVPDSPESFGWFNVAQRFAPAALLVLLLFRLQKLFNLVANVKVWTILGLLSVMGFVVIYFGVETLRWFAWSTLGLLTVLALYIANTQTALNNVSRLLLGGMVVLLALGSWEILYQVGLWMYYDFFGVSFTGFYVTIALQLTWVIPALIVILILYQRGWRPRFRPITLVCGMVAFVATVWWFATGMDIPLLFWQGEFVAINEAADPLMISVSRASQSFWLLGIATMFEGGKA